MRIPAPLVALLFHFLFTDAGAAGLPTPRHARFPGHNVSFLGSARGHAPYSDVWGYTAPDGREFAIAGAEQGLVFLDVTHRRGLHEVRFIERPESRWRDIKTYGHYAYAVNETGGGLAIVDLSDPSDPRLVTSDTRAFATAHNLYIDEERGMAFVAGSKRVPGVIILSLADPVRPAQIAAWPSPYAHDVYARDGRMFVSAIFEEALFIVDISSLPQTELLGFIANYQHAFTHNAWLTDDGTHVLTTDEEFGGAVRIWNVTDPAAPTLADYWWPDSASRSIPHNVIVDGDLAYVSHYTAGVRVVRVSDPQNLVEIGWYDTLPWTNRNSFDGCWGVFPFYPRSPGKFVASDIEGGVYVFQLDPDLIPGDREPRRPIATEAPLTIGPPRPNPARAGVEVAFDLAVPVPARASARIHDAGGRLVRVLELPAESGAVTWDGRTEAGRTAAAGVYFLRVEAVGGTASRSITIIR